MTLEPRRTALRVLLLLAVAACAGGLPGCHGSTSGTSSTGSHANKPASPQLMTMAWNGTTGYQPEAKAFYSARQNSLAWTDDGVPTAQASALISALSNAQQKGLKPEDYSASQWPQWQQKLAALHSNSSADADATLAQFDAALTVAGLRYLSDLHEGRVNPQHLNFDIDVPAKRAAFNVAGVLQQVSDATDVASTVQSIEPRSPQYAATERALSRYLELAQVPLQPLPPVAKTVEVGDSYPAMPALLARLQMEDGSVTVPAATTGAATTYTAIASDDVKTYQTRHGYTPDGKLTQQTLDSLNVPMSTRVQQIDEALERWRWLPDEFQQPRVLVNLPEFLVRTYEADHTPAFTMKVVDGQAHGGHDTPVFVKYMKYVIFRPFWGLPVSIVKKELVHHLTGDGAQAYMDKHNYQVTNGQGEVVTDWTADDLEHSRYLVRQRPGAGNSLGLVKFMFPNIYDVYMHSTPEMSLFNLTRRDRSHGCVRLNDAEKMADWVLRDQGDWTPEKIHTAMFGTSNSRQVNLNTPLAVDILYFTAMPNEDGSMHFFDDIYGYDKTLGDLLAKGMPYPADAVKVNSKLPPGSTD